MEFMKYQNQRGGRVVFQDIAKPNNDEWGSALEAVQAAFELEKKVNLALLELHGVADKNNDPQMGDFLEGNFLKEQVEAIKHLGDLITRMKRAGDGIGKT